MACSINSPPNYAYFASVFARGDQAPLGRDLLCGLLSDCERKAIEPMVLHLGAPIRPCSTSSCKAPGRRTDVSGRWLAADARYGNNPAFRDGAVVLKLSYLTAIAGDTLIWRRPIALVVPPASGHGRKPPKLRRKTPVNAPSRVDALAKRLPASAWTRTMMQECSKGPLVCDVVMVRVTEPAPDCPDRACG